MVIGRELSLSVKCKIGVFENNSRAHACYKKVGFHDTEIVKSLWCQAPNMCRAVHAEANALLNCSREQTIGADLYLTGVNPEDNTIHEAKPCPLCARMIIQSGIRNVYLRIGNGPDEYKIVPSQELGWVGEIK